MNFSLRMRSVYQLWNSYAMLSLWSFFWVLQAKVLTADWGFFIKLLVLGSFWTDSIYLSVNDTELGFALKKRTQVPLVYTWQDYIMFSKVTQVDSIRLKPLVTQQWSEGVMHDRSKSSLHKTLYAKQHGQTSIEVKKYVKENNQNFGNVHGFFFLSKHLHLLQSRSSFF